MLPISIHMITSIVCCPPLTSHVTRRARVHGGRVRGRVTSPSTTTVRALGRLGGYKTPLEQLRQVRRQVNSSGESGWPATTMYLQGQAIDYA